MHYRLLELFLALLIAGIFALIRFSPKNRKREEVTPHQNAEPQRTTAPDPLVNPTLDEIEEHGRTHGISRVPFKLNLKEGPAFECEAVLRNGFQPMVFFATGEVSAWDNRISKALEIAGIAPQGNMPAASATTA